ncbi:MAG: TSUP family transporter [Rhodothalassiaceae bacterium]
MDPAIVDPLALLLIFVTLALGSLSKGITGVGLPVLAIPVLANVFGVERAVVVLVLPGLISNLWLIRVHRREAPLARRLAPFLLFGVAGGVIGTWLLSAASPALLNRLLALWLGLYLLLLLARPQFRIPGAERLSPLFGLVAGITQGATGISAPIIAPFLTSLGLVKQQFVFAIALAFTLLAIGQMSAILHYGLLTPQRLVEGLVALVPVMLFLPLGARLGRRISPRGFARLLIVVLIAMEARLLWISFA